MAAELGTEHHQIRIGPERLAEALPHAIGAMSEPMVSHDAVAFFLLADAVSAHRKVVQSGQGADEVFGGYYLVPADARGAGRRQRGVRRRLLRPRRRRGGRPGGGGASRRRGSDAAAPLVREWFRRPGADAPVDRALRIDAELMLVEDPVKRVDTMTMAHGLEVRTPFLDHDLVELAARCPPELKLADGGKGVLKRAARGVVPDAVIDRPKGYFPVPALSHLDGPVLELVRAALTAPAARSRGLFDAAAVDRMLDDPNAHRTNLDGSTVWQLGAPGALAPDARPLAPGGAEIDVVHARAAQCLSRTRPRGDIDRRTSTAAGWGSRSTAATAPIPSPTGVDVPDVYLDRHGTARLTLCRPELLNVHLGAGVGGAEAASGYAAAMGEDVAAKQFSREDRQRYRDKVKRNLDVFARMLRDARFDAEKRSIGLEIELNLTDEAGDPAMANAAVLERIADDAFVTELGQFNVEINIPPRLLDGDVFGELETQLRGSPQRRRAEGRARSAPT